MTNYALSFHDCMHIVLSRKTGSILVTRDRMLLKIAKNYCSAARPEEL
jgi:predicted nucleic acid-binding protein